MNREAMSALCALLSGVAILAGGAGMVISFGFLASASMENITAGTSGFVAGAILIAAGLLSMTVVSTRWGARETHL